MSEPGTKQIKSCLREQVRRLLFHLPAAWSDSEESGGGAGKLGFHFPS